MSASAEFTISLSEGGGTMPQCDEDSELRAWFAESEVADEAAPVAAYAG